MRIHLVTIWQEASQQLSNHAPNLARIAGGGVIYVFKTSINPILRLVFPECRIDQHKYSVDHDFPRTTRLVKGVGRTLASASDLVTRLATQAERICRPLHQRRT